MANANANADTIKLNLPDGATLDELNGTLALAQKSAYTYKVNLTDTGKSLTLHKATRDYLRDAGVNVDALGANGYISYNKHPQVYDAVMALLNANADTFTAVGA